MLLTILRKEISKLSSGSNPVSESSEDFSLFLPKPEALRGSGFGFKVTSLNPLLLWFPNPLKGFLAWWNSILRWNSAESESGLSPAARSELISAVSAIYKSHRLQNPPFISPYKHINICFYRFFLRFSPRIFTHLVVLVRVNQRGGEVFVVVACRLWGFKPYRLCAAEIKRVVRWLC